MTSIRYCLGVFFGCGRTWGLAPTCLVLVGFYDHVVIGSKVVSVGLSDHVYFLCIHCFQHASMIYHSKVYLRFVKAKKKALWTRVDYG